jgi:CheY-like chemotaxis protein
VSDILDVTSIEAGRLVLQSRAFDLDHALRGPLEMHRLRAQAQGLAFEARFGEGTEGTFQGDDIRIRQVLDNLLSNAIKFTRHGCVTVEIDVLEAGGLARLSIAVSDTGIGFDLATAGRLFERFNQGDASVTRAFGGTGLGLSISRAIVDLMGGTLTADSTPGRGSRFQAVVPLIRSQEIDPVAGVEALPLAGEAALRVLLAEDHPTNQKVVDLILAPFEANLTIVENGALAVEAFRDETFDVVLMDIQMPVMDGLTAIQAMRGIEAGRADRRRTPIVALSANAMAHHREEAVAAGADLHVAKPVTAAALLAGIHKVLTGVSD